MRKKLLSIVILLFTILIINQSIVTASSSYSDEKVSLGFLGYRWLVVLREDRSNDIHDNPINEEWLKSLISELFDADDSMKLFAMDYDLNCYLTFAYRDGCSLDALKDFSKEEIRALNLSDYTDNEIMDFNLAGTVSDNASNYSGVFDPSQNKVEEYSGVKYAVISGIATIDGYSTEVKQYITIVDGYYYVFTLYPVDKAKSIDDSSFKKVLANSYYKTTATNAEDTSVIASTEVDNDNYDRNIALIKALKAVIFAAPLYILIGIWIKKLKKKSGKSTGSHTYDSLESKRIIIRCLVDTALR